MNNHLIADHGSILPFSAWLGEVVDPDMRAALRDDNRGHVFRRTAAKKKEEREDNGTDSQCGTPDRGT